MKLFKVLLRGVEEIEPEEQIVIGEEGRGRHAEIIPVTGNGSSFRAKRVGNGVVIVRGEFEREERCLAIIHSGGGYSKGRGYSVPKVDGVNNLLVAHRASGMAGRAASYESALCIIEKGTVFSMTGKYDDRTWYAWDGSVWIVESDPQYKARITLDLAEKGEGEWL